MPGTRSPLCLPEPAAWVPGRRFGVTFRHNREYQAEVRPQTLLPRDQLADRVHQPVFLAE